MNNMSALKGSTCFMCHRMYNTKQCVRKCHSCKTLCIMHLITALHITLVRFHKMLLNHLNCPECQWVGIITICCRHICFDRMCHSIHSGMCYKLNRHCLCQFRINDRNIRCNLKICNWIFNTFLIICDNRKCGYFRSGTGSR